MLLSLSLSVHATPQEALLESVLSLGEKAVTDSGYKPGILRHIVLFRYNETVVDEVKKKDIIKKFLNLATDCRRNGNPYIISIETGSQNSAEGADQNLEQGFLVTFKSEGDRNFYVGKPIVNGTGFFDPAHDEFKKFVGPLLHNQGGALVFDFNVEEKKSEFM